MYVCMCMTGTGRCAPDIDTLQLTLLQVLRKAGGRCLVLIPTRRTGLTSSYITKPLLTSVASDARRSKQHTNFCEIKAR